MSAANDSAQMDELEKTVDQLSNRAAAVNSSLDRLQQQQAASGYGLRGDMVARQASLKSNLAKAEEALQNRDLARAKKYADLASTDAAPAGPAPAPARRAPAPEPASEPASV